MNAFIPPRRMALSSTALLALLLAPAAHADRDARPFTATLTTQEKLFPGNDPACMPPQNLVGLSSGQGYATQMGKVTLHSVDCVALGETQYTFSNGKLVLVAANGDKLFADYNGALLPTAAYPVYTLSGRYRVTGGTGRYHHATGVGTLQGTNNVATGEGAYVAKGTIDF